MKQIKSELKNVLVELAVNDKLPQDLTQLDADVFSPVLDKIPTKPENVLNDLKGENVDWNEVEKIARLGRCIESLVECWKDVIDTYPVFNEFAYIVVSMAERKAVTKKRKGVESRNMV